MLKKVMNYLKELFRGERSFKEVSYLGLIWLDFIPLLALFYSISSLPILDNRVFLFFLVLIFFCFFNSIYIYIYLVYIFFGIKTNMKKQKKIKTVLIFFNIIFFIINVILFIFGILFILYLRYFIGG